MDRPQSKHPVDMDSDSAPSHQEPGHLPDRPHKSCTGNILSREYPSSNQPTDLLPEDDVTTSQINLERTTKQGEFGFCVCLMIDPFQSLTRRSSNFKGSSIFEGEKNVYESINLFWRGISANTRAAYSL
jgi:hypothetical protein